MFLHILQSLYTILTLFNSFEVFLEIGDFFVTLPEHLGVVLDLR